MEEIIKHIHMEILQSHCDAQSYIDDYIFLTERMENVFQKKQNIKLNVFLMLYCYEGDIKLELNNTSLHLQAHDLMISLPNTIIRLTTTSPTHKVKIFCFSNRFFRRITQTHKYTWKSICYIQEHPIKHFEENQRDVFHQYLKLIACIIRKTKRCRFPKRKVSKIRKFQKRNVFYLFKHTKGRENQNNPFPCLLFYTFNSNRTSSLPPIRLIVLSMLFS